MSGVAPMNLDPMTVARAFKESGMFPDLRSEAQAVVKIVAGQEVGFGPMASMQAVQMIQGKPTFSANALAALVKRHPAYDYRSVEHTDEVCRLEFTQHGEPIGVSEFTMADAQRAGIAGGQSWKKYPKAMLFARALSQGVRWYAPDVTAGSAAYVPEELEASAESGGDAEPIAGDGKEAEGSVGLPAGEGPGEPDEPTPIDADRAAAITEAMKARELTFKQINLLLGACGIDAVRAFSAKALGERIEGLTDEQAEAIERELGAVA